MDVAVTCFNVVSCNFSGATENIKVRTVGAVADVRDGHFYDITGILRFLVNVYLTTLFTYISLLTLNGKMTEW
jgi:hypothetical protein